MLGSVRQPLAHRARAESGPPWERVPHRELRMGEMWCILVTLGTVISTSPGSAPAAGPAVFDEKARLQLHLLVSFAGLLSWVLN